MLNCRNFAVVSAPKWLQPRWGSALGMWTSFPFCIGVMRKNFLLYSTNVSGVDSDCERGPDPIEDALDNVVRDAMISELAETMINERVSDRLGCLVAEPIRAIEKVSKVDCRQNKLPFLGF